jgi:peptide/nickel transport system substrate-binding protein
VGPTKEGAMKGSRRTAAAAVVLGTIAMLVLSGTAVAQETDATTDEPVTFTVGVDSDITSMNPFNLCCGPDYEYLELVYDLAIGFSREDLSPAPRLVTEWTPSEDSMTWTLKVRDDATFHDGEPVTAEDIAFTFELISKYQMPFFKDYFPFDPTFEVVDDTTVLWQATKPTFAPEVPAYAPVLPEHIWGRFDTGGNAPSADEAKEVRKTVKEFENDEPIGSGPFVFEERSTGQFLRFSANEDWWGGTPAEIDEIVLRVYDSQEAMVQALRSGEIDFAESITPTLFNTLEGDPNITTHVADGGCWGNIAYNFGGQDEAPGGPAPGTPTNHPAIQDLTVRQAIAHAVDKQRIVDQVYQGTAVVGDSILMPGKNGFWYTDIPPELEYPYDPALANQMLDDAGYLDTDGDGIREMPDGTNPLEFEFLTITDVDGSVDTGRLFKGFLEEIGIGVTFTTVNTNKAYDLWYTGEWDVYVWDWCPDPDPDFMLSVFTSSQCLGWSDGCYSNPRLDELYTAQQRALDRDERKAIIDEFQTIVAEELPVMVLNYWSDLQAYRSEWTGFTPSPNVENGLLLFGYTTVDTYLELQLADEGAGGGGSGGSGSPGLPAWLWVAIVGGVVVVAGLVVMSRRRGEAEDEA